MQRTRQQLPANDLEANHLEEQGQASSPVREAVQDVVILLGLTCIVAGAWQIHAALGWIVLGVLLTLVGTRI